MEIAFEYHSSLSKTEVLPFLLNLLLPVASPFLMIAFFFLNEKVRPTIQYHP
jgi:hypothetical protein